MLDGRWRKFPWRGVVAWVGPSLNGRKIAVIANGFNTPASKRNRKLGRALQFWILLVDEDPLRALQTGEDVAICGDCKLRGDGGVNRACYVAIQWWPRTIWAAFHRGVYGQISEVFERWGDPFSGWFLRLGSYGDPAAVPLWVWEAILVRNDGHCAYTHQWTGCEAGLNRIAMASVDTPEERAVAKALGFRTFRVRMPGMEILDGEIDCPAGKAAAAQRDARRAARGLEPSKVTCERCRLCDGKKGDGDRRADITIPAHGGGHGDRAQFDFARAVGHDRLRVVREET